MADVSAEVMAPVRDLVDLLDLPTCSQIEMFENNYWVTPLLDGLIRFLSTGGLPMLPSGLRAIGHRPVRLLCDMLQLILAQKRLADKGVIPTHESLLAEQAAQRTLPQDYLKHGALPITTSGASLALTMPRRLRLDAPRTLHHVMVRGLERRTDFREDADRADFVARLAT